MINEFTIILAVIGMIGLFATATVYQRANRITSRYYAQRPKGWDVVDTSIEEEA